MHDYGVEQVNLQLGPLYTVCCALCAVRIFQLFVTYRRFEIGDKGNNFVDETFLSVVLNTQSENLDAARC